MKQEDESGKSKSTNVDVTTKPNPDGSGSSTVTVNVPVSGSKDRPKVEDSPTSSADDYVSFGPDENEKPTTVRTPPPANDDDEEQEEDHVLPPDPDYSTSPARDKFNGILDDIHRMSFPDAESQQNYLDQRMAEAGLRVKATGDGNFEIVEVIPDPGRVAKQLQAKGIHDPGFIKQAIYEANGALKQVEDFARGVQAAVGGAAAAWEATSPGPDSQEIAPGSIFQVAAPALNSHVPSNFDLLIGGTMQTGATRRSRGSSRRRRGRASGTPSPQDLPGIATRTALGVSVTASLSIRLVTSTDNKLPPGVYVTPFSLFDGSSTWTVPSEPTSRRRSGPVDITQ